jgi:hypothetical protein
VDSFGDGEFAVVVSVGPSYNTQREENVANLLELSASNPMIGESSPDLLVKQMDFPDKDAIAERAKRFVSMKYPGLTDPIIDEDNGEMKQLAENLNQATQQLQQMAQEKEQMIQQLQTFDAEKQRTEAMKVEQNLKELQLKQGELIIKKEEIKADLRKQDMKGLVDIKKAELDSKTKLTVEQMKLSAQTTQTNPEGEINE